jgi:predicted  nucleic acid-binding Zn-ribbon protein
MSEVIEKLLNLQTIDTRILELEKFISSDDSPLANARKEYDSFINNITIVKREVDELFKKVNELKRNYDDKKQLYDNAQKKLSSVKNSKEYEAVLKELDLLKKEVDENEVKYLEFEEQLNKKREEEKKLEEQRNNIMEGYHENLNRKKKDDQSYRDELEDLKKKRDELLLTIKNRILSKYETLKMARNNIAIVQVEDEICKGCYMKIPPQLYVDVKKDKDLKQCPNCQRFLYYKKNDQ